ncbi:MAG: hypothetical protein HYX51_09115 [Chloroflexi bacterium]|nr:hypothetical protein [Chloroflexota bacterium]
MPRSMRPRTKVAVPAGVPVAGLCFIMAAAASSPAVLAAPRQIDANGVIENYAKKGATTDVNAYYFLRAVAADSNDPNFSDDVGRGGKYADSPRGTGSDATRVVRSTGMLYSASAKAAISFTALRDRAEKIVGYSWDSAGSKADITRLAPKPGVSEQAVARSEVSDPRTMELNEGETSVAFGIRFAAGSHLAVQDSGGDGYSQVSISGFQYSDLVPAYGPAGTGSLFNYEWSLNSVSPAASLFAFTSNPALGLDDALIRSMFMANVSGSDGDFSLVQDFVMEFDITGLVAATTFEFGGEVNHEAEAAVAVPAPVPAALVLLGSLGGLRRRRIAARG